ncbi:VVA0879 family protein [Latilactobacillus curvatus]|uniref:VVA0879 family protein n=1 Tax=Latilactobacillus curvatus TaxID=28038 RepID=UPI000FECC474|nr:VVA0879 family protein [Latilactobacillus curvatus]QAR35246.1 hypothetical protein EQK21_03940 [Latilactobacillus curvatus]
MKEQTIQEWKADGSSLFGSNPKKWKFICPSCGHVQSGEEFEKLENCNDWQDVYTKCIGRFVDGKGCNWAAFGLFRTLGKGRKVDGKTEVFDFAMPNTEVDGNE